jgi:hypothetical protein
MGYCDLPLSKGNLGRLQEESIEEDDWIVLEELIPLPDASRHRRSCWRALDAYCIATRRTYIPLLPSELPTVSLTDSLWPL